MDNKQKDQEYIQNCFRIIRFFAKNKGKQQYEENKVHLLLDLIKYLKSLVEMKSQSISRLSNSTIVNVIRCFLIEPKPLLRQHAIKFFRIILENDEIAQMYKEKNIPLFIARSLERDIRQEQKANSQQLQAEIVQSLKLIRTWIEVAPKKFPKLLANSLVSFAESADEQVKKAAIETVRKLAIGNPELCAWSGGIRLLIESVTDPQVNDLTESIIYSLLYLINEPKHREVIHVYLDLPSLFSIFTDIDQAVDSTKYRNQKIDPTKFESQLNLAKKAIITMLKSWTGLIFLGFEKTALKSMIQALRQPIKSIIRKAIYEILGELLSIGCNENQVGSGLRVQNLLNYYLVMLIKLLLECDLFKILVELSGIEDPQISLDAQKYLKQLTQLMFNLLPDSNQYTDFLISSANQSENLLVDLKAWSSNIVNTMGNYVFDSLNEKKKKSVPSRFLYQCENLYLTTQLGLPSHRINKETIIKIRYQMEAQADDAKFQILLKQSQVLDNSQYQKWNWDAILDIIETYINNPQRFNEALRNRFLKRVLSFYLPSKMAFIDIDWTASNDKAFQYAKIGYLLLQQLIKTEQGRKLLKLVPDTLLEFNKSFLADLHHLLSSEVPGSGQPHPAKNLLSPRYFQVKMIRELISWIGLFSSSKNGMDLLNSFNIFDILINYIEPSGQRDHILILILFCLEYGKVQENKSKEFLQICLENGSINLQKAGLELVRLNYRSELQDFSTWAIDILVTKLYSPHPEIISKAIDVIQEVTQNTDNMNAFLEKCPQVSDMEQGCSQFLITLLSYKKGFEKLTVVNKWTSNELKRWADSENKEYVDKVEKCLLYALDFVGLEQNSNNFRFPDLLNNPENSFVTLGFVHRMPWIMQVQYSCDEFTGTLNFGVSIEYNGSQNNEFILVGKPTKEQEKIMSESSNFVITMSLQVGKCYIDNNCKEINEPFEIRTDFNEKKHKAEFIDNKYYLEKNGVYFILDSINDKRQIKLSQIKIHLKMGENRSNMVKIPPHIFGEVVKTKKGVELLQKERYLDKFLEDIKNENSPVLDKRASLWALGHIGQCKRGIQLLNQYNAVQDIVKIAENSQSLSVRGTCLYILNMLCSTKEGRLELEKYQWLSHWNSNLGYICIPQHTNQFFNIHYEYMNEQQQNQLVPPPPKPVSKSISQLASILQNNEESHESLVIPHKTRNTYWALQKAEWQKFEQIQQSLHLNEDQLKLLENIALLSNLLTFKHATKEIRSIARKKPDLFRDRFVFQSVLLMLSFYRFKNEARKMIFGFFDKHITQTTIFVTLDANKQITESII